MAEKFAGRSVYEYTFSNPIRYIDPTGMGPIDDISAWYQRNETRVVASVKLAGNTIGAVACAAVTAVPGGQVVGIIGVAYFANNMSANIMEIATNESQETLFHQGIRKGSEALGASPNTANTIADYTDFGVGLAFGTTSGNLTVSSQSRLITSSTTVARTSLQMPQKTATLTSRSVISSDKDLVGQAGIYIHEFASGTKYVGQAKNLGSRPWDSLKELITLGSKGTNKATALNNGDSYVRTYFLKLKDTAYKTLDELEGAYINNLGGVMQKSVNGTKIPVGTYNIKRVNP